LFDFDLQPLLSFVDAGDKGDRPRT
jgi:hypothetical protein